MTMITKEREARAHAWEARRSMRNVGGVERGARLLAGAGAAVGAAALGGLWLRVVLGLASAAGLLTGAAGYCPVNRKVGRDSYHRDLL